MQKLSMFDNKENVICPKCGVKIEGGYCECFKPSESQREVKNIKITYDNGDIEYLIKGYLIAFDDEGNSNCIGFNV